MAFIREKYWIIVLSCMLTVALTSTAAVIFGFMYIKASAENDRLKFSELISNKQHLLLQDQCRDYEYKFRTVGTYDEGYKAAIFKMSHPEGGTFQEGYEAAKLVFKNGTYVDGYHNAIYQMGQMKSLEIKSNEKGQLNE